MADPEALMAHQGLRQVDQVSLALTRNNPEHRALDQAKVLVEGLVCLVLDQA